MKNIEEVYVLRNKNDDTALGVAYSEYGLRSVANKNGVYLYCEGRVTEYAVALGAKRSNQVYIEKFRRKNFQDRKRNNIEKYWVRVAKNKLYQP